MLPTQTRFAAASAKGTGLPPFDGRAGPHETVKRPTAWTTRKAGLKGIAPVYGWPITLALVGTGALYLYSQCSDALASLLLCTALTFLLVRRPIRQDGTLGDNCL